METNTINLDGVGDAYCLMAQVYELIARVETTEDYDGSPGEGPKDSIETFAFLVMESMRDSITPIDPSPIVNESRIDYEIGLVCALEWQLRHFTERWGRSSELSFAALNLLLLTRMKLRQELAEMGAMREKTNEAKEPEPAPHRARKVRADAQAVTQ